jgi:hypothetical protein
MEMGLPYLACMMVAASYFHLPPRVLPSIQAVEGGYPGAVHLNKDGSDDLGVMQINTRWVQPVAAYRHTSQDVSRDWLIHDPCGNIAWAGAILDAYRAQERGDLMRAIGDYHSHTVPLNRSYRDAVTAKAIALFGD